MEYSDSDVQHARETLTFLLDEVDERVRAFRGTPEQLAGVAIEVGRDLDPDTGDAARARNIAVFYTRYAAALNLEQEARETARADYED